MYKDSEAILILRKKQFSSILKELNLQQRQCLRNMDKGGSNYDGNYDELHNNEFTMDESYIWIDRNSDRQNSPFNEIPEALDRMYDNFDNNGGQVNPEYFWLRTCVEPGVYGSDDGGTGSSHGNGIPIGMAYSLLAYTDEAEDIDTHPDPEIFKLGEDEGCAVLAMSLQSEMVEYFSEHADEDIKDFIEKYRIYHVKNEDEAELWILANMPIERDYDNDEATDWRRLASFFEEAYDECSGNSVLHVFPHTGPVSDWYGIGGKFVKWDDVYNLSYDEYNDTSLIYGNIYPEDTPFELELQRYIRVKGEPGNES